MFMYNEQNIFPENGLKLSETALLQSDLSSHAVFVHRQMCKYMLKYILDRYIFYIFVVSGLNSRRDSIVSVSVMFVDFCATHIISVMKCFSEAVHQI